MLKRWPDTHLATFIMVRQMHYICNVDVDGGLITVGARCLLSVDALTSDFL